MDIPPLGIRALLQRSAALALGVVLLTAADGLGQDHHGEHGHQEMHHHQEMHGQAMMGMMGMMGRTGMMEGPQFALRERERLGLSGEQVQALESIHESLHQAHMETMTEMQAAREEVEAAMEDHLDEARARAALERMAGMHVEMGLSMLQARQQTRETLTEEQRQRLAEAAQERMHHMQEMMERMRGMMMPGMGGPGMRGPGMRGPGQDGTSPDTSSPLQP